MLAESPVHFRKSWGAAKTVELDPNTLAPRTAKAFAAPAPDSWLSPKLVCAAECRIVLQDLGGDIFTWAPANASRTRMGLGTRTDPATLLDVSFRSGQLLVASAKTLHLKRSPWSVEEISIVRGDKRGSHARSVSKIAPAPFGPRSPFQWQPPIDATFVPDGVVFFKRYFNFREPDQTRVVAGLLGLRR